MPLRLLLTLSLLLIADAAARDVAMAELRAESSRLVARHLQLDTVPSPASLRFEQGPRAGVAAFRAEATATLRGRLTHPVQDRGSISFWFQTDRLFRSGTDTRVFEQKLLEIDDLIAATFVVEPESVTLYIGWGPRKDVLTKGARGERRGISFDQVLRVILPEWPGPAWTHVAVHWDGQKGEANVFLNGTPYQRPGARIEPWPCRPGRTLTVHTGPRFALAEVQVGTLPFDVAGLRATVGATHWGTLDRLLGTADLGPLDGASIRGDLLYARTLDRPDDIDGWRMEGPAELAFDQRGMTMRSLRPKGPNGHIVHWIDHDFPADFMLQFEFEVLAEHGLNILFFSARGTEGQDAFDPGLTPRDGTFIQYTHGDLDSYHISYFANSPNDPRSVANLRKNSGFWLLANGPVGVESGGHGRIHRALLIKQGARIRMAVDGRTIIDFTDDGRRAGPVWQGGRIGLRQMQWSATRYRHLKVYSCTDPQRERAASSVTR